MCHKPELNNQSHSQQRGSALVIALFIIVVMALLVGAMSKLLSASSESVSYEVLGTRAFFAAQSGMERTLSLLYALDQATLTDCPTLPVVMDFSSVAGLEQCTAVPGCTPAASTTETGVTHFYLTSTGRCGTNGVSSSRTIEMEVWQ